MTQILMSPQAMQLTLETLANSLLERHGNCQNLALIGIQRRGASMAQRLGVLMAAALKKPVPNGTLDITLYRDDWTTKTPKPAVLQTSIPFDVAGKNLVIIDDVLFTGRTIRAALEALADFGRPSKVELLVLVDRGHRELPIHADYVGLTVPTKKSDRVDVLMQEHDNCDEVRLVEIA